MTVNTPTIEETTATTLPMTTATWTGWLEKNPGSNTPVQGQTASRLWSGGSSESSVGPATTRIRPWSTWT